MTADSPSSETSSFLTVAAPAEVETRVRGSRFIAAIRGVEGEADARAFLDERTRSYFDAKHHCAAWRLRDGLWRAIDAGEPAGSAGAPILASLDRAVLSDAAIVVTRYFGGTKLGVGGLARAYGDAATAVIDVAQKRRGVPAVRAMVSYPYAFTPQVMRALEQFGAGSIQHGFDTAAEEAEVTFVIPAGRREEMTANLLESSRGSLGLKVLEAVVLYEAVTG